MKHDVNGYRRGCRCDTCREAHAVWAVAYRARRYTGFTGPDCGNASRSTYINQGCRCDKCRAANAAAMAEYRGRKRGNQATAGSREA